MRLFNFIIVTLLLTSYVNLICAQNPNAGRVMEVDAPCKSTGNPKPVQAPDIDSPPVTSAPVKAKDTLKVMHYKFDFKPLSSEYIANKKQSDTAISANGSSSSYWNENSKSSDFSEANEYSSGNSSITSSSNNTASITSPSLSTKTKDSSNTKNVYPEHNCGVLKPYISATPDTTTISSVTDYDNPNNTVYYPKVESTVNSEELDRALSQWDVDDQLKIIFWAAVGVAAIVLGSKYIRKAFEDEE